MDEKALDLPARSRFGEGRAQPFNNETLGIQCPEKIGFPVTRTVTHNLKWAHSKALESGCLLRFYAPPFDCDTVPWRER